MIDECLGPTWSDVCLTSLCVSLLRKPAAGSVCRETYSIVFLPRISQHNTCDSCRVATAQFWQAFGGQDTPASDLFKKRKSPKYPWLTNHPSLPARVAIQTACRVLWPAHRFLNDVRHDALLALNSANLYCSFYFGYSLVELTLLSSLLSDLVRSSVLT